MLKIKYNINKFTIIFSEKIWRKKWTQKNLLQPLLASVPLSCFSISAPLLLVFCFSASFFFSSLLVSASLLLQPSFSFQFRGSPFCFSVPHFSPTLTFFFSFGCPLLFSPKYFFSAQTFFNFSAQTFLLQFSHSSLLLFFLLYSFLVQPSFLSFNASFFSFL